MSERKPQDKRKPPVTLAPLSFDQAIDGLLAIKPKPAKKKAAGKKKG